MTERRGHGGGWLAYSAMHFNRIVLGSFCIVSLGLWMSSAKLLMSSSLREQGRVISCVYFNGFRLREHQYGTLPGGAELACPVVKLG